MAVVPTNDKNDNKKRKTHADDNDDDTNNQKSKIFKVKIIDKVHMMRDKKIMS